MKKQMMAVYVFTVQILAVSGTVADLSDAKHPRIWISAEQVEELRKRITSTVKSPLGFVPAEVFVSFKRTADRYAKEGKFTFSVTMPGVRGRPPKEYSYTLSDDAPPRHDDYPHYPPWTEMSRRIEERLLYLSFACLVTGDENYFRKAKEIVLHLCKWPIIWTDPSYPNHGACLDTAHFVTGVAIFYDWCYSVLTEDERALIRKSLLEKGLEPMKKAIPRHDPLITKNFNLSAVMTGGLGLGTVALLGEDKRANELLSTAIDFAKKYFFDVQGKDGGCPEGPMYGTYGGDSLAMFILAMQTAGIEHDLLKHRFFATLPRYCISMLCPNDNHHAGFGDGGLMRPLPISMTLLAIEGNKDAVWYLRQIDYLHPWSPRTSIPIFLALVMNAEKLPIPKEPKWNPSAAFIDIGYASLRDRFSTDAAFMAFKCGPPEYDVDHNHYDHNSFQINYNGTWIATDPGYTSFWDPADNKYGRSTFGHNTIALDVNESYLTDMRVPITGHDQVCRNNAKIVRYYTSAKFDYVKGCAAEAYNEANVGATYIHFFRKGEGMAFASIAGPKLSSSEWKQYEFSVVAPEGADVFCLGLQYHQTTGSIWYDDAELFVDGKKLDLPNPGFEEGTDEDFKSGRQGWKSRGWAADAGKHEIDSTTARSGKRSARIDAPGGYYYWFPYGPSNMLPIKPGQEITARFWAKCSGRKVMEQADREVLFIKPHIFVVRDTLRAVAPHSFSFMLHTLGTIEVKGGNEAVLEDGAARLQVHTFSPAGITLKSDFYKGAEARGPYLNCATGKTKATTITSVLIARKRPFKLMNPGFEQGMVNWTPRTAEGSLKNHVIDEQVAYSGKKSGRIDAPGGYYYTPKFPVKAGSKINVRFWAKVEGGEGKFACVYFFGYPGIRDVTGPVISGNQWKKYEFSVEVPQDFSEALVAFRFWGKKRIWYDDIDITIEDPQATKVEESGKVSAVEEAERGVVIELDGLRHLVVFPESPDEPDIFIGGHKVHCKGEIGCISIDSKGKVVGAFLSHGTELSLDGRVLLRSAKPRTMTRP